jgi:AcrR family transcriptional regulator
MSEHPARERILDVTRELMACDTNEHAITVGQVAEAAQVSRATLYRYFPNKAALLSAAGIEAATLPGPLTPRVRILEAALEVIGERGMHAATLEEIAARAGLSLSGLHWHYRNRDELAADLVRYIPFISAVEEELAQAEAASADLESQLTHIAAVILAGIEKRHGVARFMLFESAVYPDVAQLVSTHSLGRVLPLLTRLFARHAAHGKLRPGSAQVRAQAFLSLFLWLGLLRPTFGPLLAPDDHATAREYIDLL